jgi:catechol 2,3-dioxygenase-like lactoylglutathione lyase family enzyme
MGGIHHIDITVIDLGRSTAFYERWLLLMGFRRGVDVDGNPIWVGEHCEIGLTPARTECREHDRYSPGLHHLAFAAPDRAAVDALHHRLLELGVEVLDAPAEYPQYCPGYYAVFFADPDGIKLEYVFTPKWPA